MLKTIKGLKASLLDLTTMPLEGIGEHLLQIRRKKSTRKANKKKRNAQKGKTIINPEKPEEPSTLEPQVTSQTFSPDSFESKTKANLPGLFTEENKEATGATKCSIESGLVAPSMNTTTIESSCSVQQDLRSQIPPASSPQYSVTDSNLFIEPHFSL